MTPRAQPPAVVAWHAIHPPEPGVDAPDVIDPPAALERDVRALLSAGYRIVTAGELATGVAPGAAAAAGLACITFDDGWRDGLTVAAPLLAALGVRATFFVCPGLFGNHDPRMGVAGHVLTLAEAHELHAAGMELAAHSLTHPDLRLLGDRELRDELEGSRDAVEAITGEPCRTFAYPFGHHDARVRRAAAAAGYRLAFQYGLGPWQPLAAPRHVWPWAAASRAAAPVAQAA